MLKHYFLSIKVESVDEDESQTLPQSLTDLILATNTSIRETEELGQLHIFFNESN